MRFEQYAGDLEAWYDVYAFPLGSWNSRSVGVLCTDITTRKKSEISLKKLNENLEYQVKKRTAELRENNELLQMIFDTVNQGIFLLKPRFGRTKLSWAESRCRKIRCFRNPEANYAHGKIGQFRGLPGT